MSRGVGIFQRRILRILAAPPESVGGRVMVDEEGRQWLPLDALRAVMTDEERARLPPDDPWKTIAHVDDANVLRAAYALAARGMVWFHPSTSPRYRASDAELALNPASPETQRFLRDAGLEVADYAALAAAWAAAVQARSAWLRGE
jgi:hypothetical protein